MRVDSSASHPRPVCGAHGTVPRGATATYSNVPCMPHQTVVVDVFVGLGGVRPPTYRRGVSDVGIGT